MMDWWAWLLIGFAVGSIWRFEWYVKVTVDGAGMERRVRLWDWWRRDV